MASTSMRRRWPVVCGCGCGWPVRAAATVCSRPGMPVRWPDMSCGPRRLRWPGLEGLEAADEVAEVGQHDQPGAVVPGDVQLPDAGVVAGDGAGVAGPQPGVWVAGVDQGDAVAGLPV